MIHVVSLYRRWLLCIALKLKRSKRSTSTLEVIFSYNAQHVASLNGPQALAPKVHFQRNPLALCFIPFSKLLISLPNFH